MSEIILAWKVLISSVFRDQHFCPLPRSWSLDTRVESSHCSAAKSCLTHFIASSHLSTIWLPLSGKLQKISQRSYYITPQISSPLNSPGLSTAPNLGMFLAAGDGLSCLPSSTGPLFTHASPDSVSTHAIPLHKKHLPGLPQACPVFSVCQVSV